MSRYRNRDRPCFDDYKEAENTSLYRPRYNSCNNQCDRPRPRCIEQKQSDTHEQHTNISGLEMKIKPYQQRMISCTGDCHSEIAMIIDACVHWQSANNGNQSNSASIITRSRKEYKRYVNNILNPHANHQNNQVL